MSDTDEQVVPHEQAEAFDPMAHLMDLRGKSYLNVASRIRWFRSEHPDWCIETEIDCIDLDKKVPWKERGKPGYARMRAKIYDDQSRLMSTGTKTEWCDNFEDALEKCESGAVGRALAFLGYGTPLDSELDEGRVCDSPRDQRAPLSRDFSSGSARGVVGRPTPTATTAPESPQDAMLAQGFTFLMQQSKKAGFASIEEAAAHFHWDMQAIRSELDAVKAARAMINAYIAQQGA